MRSLFSKLWADDKGVVLSAELALLLAIVVIGIIPGLVALRNAADSKLGTLANGILAIDTSYQYSSWTISQTFEATESADGASSDGGEGKNLATVGGVQYIPDVEQLQSSTRGDVDHSTPHVFGEEVEVQP